MFFFLQAEDGIRDLVRSRGLGDVYKRQVIAKREGPIRAVSDLKGKRVAVGAKDSPQATLIPVSYTHLTLPTSDLV